MLNQMAITGARDTGLTEALRQTYEAGEQPSFLQQPRQPLQQQPGQPYSSAAWSGISGSIHTRRRSSPAWSGIARSFASSTLL